ncbi:hypothetical protein [uncultured Jatrophihabitans sp.]
MTADVEQLQVEIAELEALIIEPGATGPGRSGSGWQPTPEPQPWLVARSA